MIPWEVLLPHLSPVLPVVLRSSPQSHLPSSQHLVLFHTACFSQGYTWTVLFYYYRSHCGQHPFLFPSNVFSKWDAYNKGYAQASGCALTLFPAFMCADLICAHSINCFPWAKAPQAPTFRRGPFHFSKSISSYLLHVSPKVPTNTSNPLLKSGLIFSTKSSPLTRCQILVDDTSIHQSLLPEMVSVSSELHGLCPAGAEVI